MDHRHVRVSICELQWHASSSLAQDTVKCWPLWTDSPPLRKLFAMVSTVDQYFVLGTLIHNQETLGHNARVRSCTKGNEKHRMSVGKHSIDDLIHALWFKQENDNQNRTPGNHFSPSLLDS